MEEHPLRRSWTLWFDCPAYQSRSEDWFANLDNVLTFNTVEDFWKLINNIDPPSQLKPNSNYYFFVKEVKPMWEDPLNAKGGKWTIELTGPQRGDMDKLFLNTLMALVGETVEFGDQVTGVIGSQRKSKSRITIWTKDASNEEACKGIATSLRKLLGIEERNLQYQAHDACLKKGAVVRNDKVLYEI